MDYSFFTQATNFLEAYPILTALFCVLMFIVPFILIFLEDKHPGLFDKYMDTISTLIIVALYLGFLGMIVASLIKFLFYM